MKKSYSSERERQERIKEIEDEHGHGKTSNGRKVYISPSEAGSKVIVDRLGDEGLIKKVKDADQSSDDNSSSDSSSSNVSSYSPSHSDYNDWVESTATNHGG